MSELHVVLGASGALGSAIVNHLVAEEIPVRAVARDKAHAENVLPDGVEIVSADVMDEASLVKACAGASVIYDCVYVSSGLERATQNVLRAAEAVRARLVFPSNALVYGPLQQVPATEDHPQAATSYRGTLRKRLEAMLLDAHTAGRVAVVIPRLATFFGPNVHGTFMSAIFESAYKNQKALWFCRADMPHDLVYLSDAAAACVLLATDDEAYGQAWHIPGAGPLTGEQFITLVYQAFGAPPRVGVRTRRFFSLAALIAPQVREIVEVLYEFDQPFILDGSKFARAYPDFRYTPHERAVQETAAWYREYFEALKAQRAA
ncbi:MAG: NAD-dependent epimerase/dehydratase family protein [Thermoflexales bacterium]|nr:NAD-dependent epimerase/dehydratase family protein [Thermoflexales bacterium]